MDLINSRFGFLQKFNLIKQSSALPLQNRRYGKLRAKVIIDTKQLPL